MEAVSGYQGWASARGAFARRPGRTEVSRCGAGFWGWSWRWWSSPDARGRVTSRGREKTTPPVQWTWVHRRRVNRAIRVRPSNLDLEARGQGVGKGMRSSAIAAARLTALEAYLAETDADE